MDLFKNLQEAFRLFKAGRKNAARIAFNILPEDFRVRALRIAVALLEVDEVPLEHVIEVSTPFGSFFFAEEDEGDEPTIIRSDFTHTLPEIVDG